MTETLGPSLLVAAPGLQCGFFHHTVVLLVDHRDDGSLGFVLNRPSGVKMKQVLEHVGVALPDAPPDTPILVGGPVSPETGWIVMDPRDGALPDDGVLRVGDSLAVCANLEMLERIAKRTAPSRHVMMLGYAGWGPGQLDDEIRQGSWIVVDLDVDFVFDTPADACWNAALGKLGIDPARVVGSVVADA